MGVNHFNNCIHVFPPQPSFAAMVPLSNNMSYSPLAQWETVPTTTTKTVKNIHSVEMKSSGDAGLPMPTHSNMSPLQGEEGYEQKSDKKREKENWILLLWVFVSICQG
jgi:hypothetical protein